MSNLKVSDYMTRDVAAEEADTSLDKIIEIFNEGVIRHVPIVDKDFRPVGIISERDTRVLENKEFASKYTAREIMQEEPVLVWSTSALKSVAAMMAYKKLGSVIVIDHDHKVEGIFTSTDALYALFDILDDEPLEKHLDENIVAYLN